ncbi:YjgN family protein [Azoarcus olearius]|uniref:Hypothetical membrane protein n=1 Tax=Azoarcus sp. (strain BH72) TaxID=418699 RepID=A1KBG9_AZOSB|nr:YjgN family protein [Azoarcus olearius]CAL96175.1 hypothetical membrane protein [Azoarcus olearius]
MSEAVYAVVFRGEILDGFSREQVQEGFGRLFGLGADKLEQLFSHPKVVLKKGLSRDEADRYRITLGSIGAVVSVEAPAAQQFVTSAPSPAAQPDPAVAASTAVTQVVARAPAPAAAQVDPMAPTMVVTPASRPQAADETVMVQRPAALAASAAPAFDHGAQTMIIPPSRPTLEPAAGAGAPPAGGVARAAATPDAEPRVLPFQFFGEGGEFFRIWIVNVLLTIVTLGIYSAWAKVRTQRYFYGNTQLDGSSFDYLGDPIKILKGRAIAFVLFVLYSMAGEISPILGLLALLLFLAAMPWMIVRGLAFRNHNSAWRGVRFGFDGKLAEAGKAFVLWPLLAAITFGILAPMALHKQQHFMVGNSRYGTCRFGLELGVRSFYMMVLVLIGIFIGGMAAAMLVGWLIPFLSPLVMIATYVAAFAYFKVRFTNLVYGNTALAGNRFEATYELPGYARLMAVNTLLTVLTLGLFYPWAKVRNARYAAEHIALVAEDDLDSFVAARQEEVAAAGGEVADLFDVDLGL